MEEEDCELKIKKGEINNESSKLFYFKFSYNFTILIKTLK